MNIFKRGGFVGLPKSWNRYIIGIVVIALSVAFLLYQQIILSLVVLGLGAIVTVINNDFTEEKPLKKKKSLLLSISKNDQKEKLSTFRSVMAYAVLVLGFFFIVHNVIWAPPIGSELVFGMQFITGAYYIAHGKFKKFGEE